MASLARIVLSFTDISAADQANALRPTTNSRRQSIVRLANLLHRMARGARTGSVELCTGVAKAVGTITSTGAATDADTITVCGVVITAETGTVGNNEFAPSATPATQAANIAAAINTSTSTRLTGAVVATAAAGVVTLTAKAPGAIGNGLSLAESMDNVTVVDFAGGSDGTRTPLAAGEALT